MLQHEAHRLDVDENSTTQDTIAKLANFARPGTETINLVYDGRRLKSYESIDIAKDYLSAETELAPARRCSRADDFWKRRREDMSRADLARQKPDARGESAEILRPQPHPPKHIRPAGPVPVPPPADHEEEEEEQEDAASHDRSVVAIEGDDKSEVQAIHEEDQTAVAAGDEAEVEIVTAESQNQVQVVADDKHEDQSAEEDHTTIAVRDEAEVEIVTAESQNQVQVVADDEPVALAHQEERIEDASAGRRAAAVVEEEEEEEEETMTEQKVEILDRDTEEHEDAEPIADVEDAAASADEPEQMDISGGDTIDGTELDEDQEQPHHVIIEEEEEEEEAPQESDQFLATQDSIQPGPIIEEEEEEDGNISEITDSQLMATEQREDQHQGAGNINSIFDEGEDEQNADD
jgi:hypothetical protein